MTKIDLWHDATLAAISLEWWPRSVWNRWPPSSESAFRSAIALARDVHTYDLLSIALERQNRYDDAVRVIEAAIALSPEDPKLLGRLETIAARRDVGTQIDRLIRSVDSVTLKVLPQGDGKLLFSGSGEDGILRHLFQ